MSPPPGADRDGCPGCGHSGTEIDSIATTGGDLSKMFDIQNRQFTVVLCANYGYSELYHGQSSGSFADLLLG